MNDVRLHSAPSLVDGPSSSRPIGEITPDLAGLSVAGLQDGRAFTWTATDDSFATLDACQYLADGPCAHAAAAGEPVETNPQKLLREGRWELFASACLAVGVQASMSLPVTRLRDGGRTVVVGTVNLYGGEPDAFHGRRDELLDWSSRWRPTAGLDRAAATLAVRREKASLPERHRDQNAVDWVVPILAARLGIDVGLAADRLHDAATRAGLPESRAAALLIDVIATA